MAKKKPSLAAVVILMIIFWPVGVYLLYRYLTYDKIEIFRNSNILRNFAIVFAALGLLAMIGGVDYIAGGLFLLIGAAIMFYQSIRMKKAAERYKQYIELIVNQEYKTIDDVASTSGHPSDMVKKDLKKAIEYGIFKNADIDFFTGSITIHKPQGSSYEPEANNEFSSVQCPNCGANNKIPKGQVSACEYCGSALQG